MLKEMQGPIKGVRSNGKSLRRVGAAGALLGLLLLSGCTNKREVSAPAAPYAAGPATGVEMYRSGAAPQFTSAALYLPGSTTRSLVKYQAVDGLAVMEGDIVLGPTHALNQRYGAPRLQQGVRSAVVMADRSYLWPDGVLPYQIDSSAASRRADIDWAIEHLSTTPLRLRPRTSSDKDYVVFSDRSSGCWSELGRIGGAQTIQVEPGCGRGSIVHEILHAAGFMHEQTRADRDKHVTVVWDEIDPGKEHNFEQRPDLLQDIGDYDYDSILHYSAYAFSRRGNPTIIPKVNARIGNREGLSRLDRAAIEQVYGTGTATQVTTTTPVSPTPVTPTPAPVTPTPPPTPAKPTVVSGMYAGQYSSSQGVVTCNQSSASVHCSFPAGTLACSANGTRLDCGWSGQGFGRALFTQGADGVLTGTWGDFFSTNSRGAWTMTPSNSAGQATAPVTPAPTTPAPTPAPTPVTPTTPTPAPTQAAVALSGNFSSSRGSMSCTDAGTRVTCDFRELSGVTGRLECNKDATGLKLSCTWATFLPQPGGGRAVFTRPNVGSRTLQGTWGHFLADTGGGVWTAEGQ